MRNLINFLIRYSVVFLFILLEGIAIYLMAQDRKYQGSIILSSGNTVVAEMYQWSNTVVEFFKLKAANENLSEENTALKNKIIVLESKLASVQPHIKDTVHFRIPPEMEYRFISAKVINNSTNKKLNYITIDKGSLSGIKPDMGVVSEEGVVGIVKNVSPQYSVIIPILNPKIEISCKFTKSNYSGPLVWNSDDYDYRYAGLNDIARHVEFSLGDSLVTTGFTNAFPEGIPVGRIEDFNIKPSDAYFNIKVKLAVNFRTLSYVKVINFVNFEEQKQLEKEAEEQKQ